MKDGAVYEISVDDEQLSAWVMTAQGETFVVTVTYGPEAMVPAGATLHAREIEAESEEYQALLGQANEALETEGRLEPGEEAPVQELGEQDLPTDEEPIEEALEEIIEVPEIAEARFFDISILADGEPVEPAAAVQVSIAYAEPMMVEEAEVATIVHFAETGVEIIAPETVRDETGVSEFIFDTQSFSDFGVLKKKTGEIFEKGLIAYFSFDDGLTGVGANGNTVAIADPQEGDQKIQNEGGVSGYYLDLTANDANDDESPIYYLLKKNDEAGKGLLDSYGRNELTVSYWSNITVEPGSNWGFFAAPSAVTQIWGSQTYAGIIQDVNGVRAERNRNASNTTASSTYKPFIADAVWHHIVAVYGKDDITLYVDGEKVGHCDNTIRLTDLLGSGSVVQVGKGNWGNGEYFVGRLDELSLYNYALSDNEVEQLFQAYDYEPPTESVTAVKMSVGELAELLQNNTTDGGAPLRVVAYYRVPSGVDGKYDCYALAGDGKLVKVYDVGDTICLRILSNELEWEMHVYKDGGADAGNGDTLTGYADFKNYATGKYLAPQAEGGLTEVGSEKPGVVLNGLLEETYGSTITGWSDLAKDTFGIQLSEDHKTYGSGPISEAAELMFAVVDPPDKTGNTLHTVATVDSVAKGITIKMYDFHDPALLKNADDTIRSPWRSQEQTDVLGLESIEPPRNSGATQGLVYKTLGEDGFPKASLNDGASLGTLFSPDNLVSEANHLFLKSVYDATGYFSYDSGENYAYLTDGSAKSTGVKDFTLYRELAAPEMETVPAGHKGNFFPYISLEYLAENNIAFPLKDRVATYDGDLAELPDENLLKGQKLYKIVKPAEAKATDTYFFGMTMEAEFYQGRGGVDDRGKDIVYEFDGDDDMWVFIDGVLVLDIGGCHGAVSGTINFQTGDVRINRIKDEPDAYTTTIKALFTEAGVAEKYAWSGNTFADYTQHSFKMFYMERGAYASNLKINFNLLTVEPSSFTLEKQFPDGVQSKYGDARFAYQVYTQNADESYNLYDPTALTSGAITFEGTGEVVYDSAWKTELSAEEYAAKIAASEAYDATATFGGITYQHVFYLRPGEAMTFPMVDKSVQYRVEEINLSTGQIERVSVNGNVVWRADDNASADIAQSTTDTVQNRGRVVYCNEPYLSDLRITKRIETPRVDEGATFSFNVLLESNETNRLIPYYPGKYYVVKEVENEERYFRFNRGSQQWEEQETDEPAPYYTGVSGSISNIPEGYTVVIEDLLVGTDFAIVERDIPEGYSYVGTCVTGAGTPEAGVTDPSGEIPSRGTIKKGTAAKLTLINHQDMRITLLKTDLDGHALNGAEFSLIKLKGPEFNDKDETFAARTLTSDTEGVLLKQGFLSSGTYLLTETHAPAGYNLLTNSIKIVVDNENRSVTATYDDGSGVLKTEDTLGESNIYTISICNSPGYSLPSTGGIGTARVYGIGAALILLGLALLLRRRKEY